jgi:hypothetical protein
VMVEASSDDQPVDRWVEKHRQPATVPEELVERARLEDAVHRAAHQRPISADTLRRRLGIGAQRSRWLVALIRSEVPRV